MKQYITKDQWNEITEAQQDSFKSEIEPDEVAYIGDVEHCSECGNNCLPSIGQMIEFLDEENKDWKIEKTTYNERGGWFWSVNGKKQYEKFLVDALWESVKSVLEEK